MKTFGLLFITLLLFYACTNKSGISSVDPVNWEKRKAEIGPVDSLLAGSTYLPVYSQIYHLHERETYGLTVTVSIRNISPVDTVFLLNANYFNTTGEQIRRYFNHPVFIKPLETIEIVIDETDNSGGTGANFVFDWATKPACHEPLFEAVMISTTGQQGLSFLTRGIKISK